MKLLFDQNLSDRLVRAFDASFPGSAHVKNIGLDRSDDEVIWIEAADEGFCIVSKDDDSRQRSFLCGPTQCDLAQGRELLDRNDRGNAAAPHPTDSLVWRG